MYLNRVIQAKDHAISSLVELLPLQIVKYAERFGYDARNTIGYIVEYFHPHLNWLVVDKFAGFCILSSLASEFTKF